jgi:propanol-preferring alcohol dehydrogenase
MVFFTCPACPLPMGNAGMKYQELEMKAMVLEQTMKLGEGKEPLRQAALPEPIPQSGQVLIKVLTCGVCHTELDEIEGRLPPSQLPIILGHQVVGIVEQVGEGVRQHRVGRRVGVGWIYQSCGHCAYCLAGKENLCPEFQATGKDANGGYAEYMVIGEEYAFPVPDALSDAEAAPLLCAGAIGYRSLRLSGIGEGQRLGLTGFGASGHLVLQMARQRWPDVPVYVFSRNEGERQFALQLGAKWAGDIGEKSPQALHSIIDTTPVWKPVVEALGNLQPGGRLVINAIRKEESDKSALQRLDYAQDLWMEKEIKSVANATRADIREFLQLAGEIGLRPEVQEYALKDANKALLELRKGGVRGGKVLHIA